MNFQNKRIFALCLAVLLVTPILTCGVCATETYIFELMPDVEYLDSASSIFNAASGVYLYNGILPEGLYTVNYCFADGTCFLASREPVFVEYSLERIEGDVDLYSFGDYCDLDVFGDNGISIGSVTFSLRVQYYPDTPELGTVAAFFNESDKSLFGEAYFMEFVPVESSSSDLTSSVADGLINIIDWVGMVVDSLLSGPLVPLLAIMAVPISVTALVFSIKAIRRTSWSA